MTTVRVTTTTDVVLEHASRLGKARAGENRWQTQARTLDELGYQITPKPELTQADAAQEGETWSVSWVEPGTIDRESGEVIPPGWWVIGSSGASDDYPFATIHVEFSYDENGDDITEQVARRVAARPGT